MTKLFMSAHLASVGYYQLSGDLPYVTMPFIVDTGAAVTVLKKSDWDIPARRSQIRWLHEPGVPARLDGLPDKTYKLGGIGGGAVDVYFGCVCLCFFKVSQPGNPVLNARLVLSQAFSARPICLGA